MATTEFLELRAGLGHHGPSSMMPRHRRIGDDGFTYPHVEPFPPPQQAEDVPRPDQPARNHRNPCPDGEFKGTGTQRRHPSGIMATLPLREDADEVASSQVTTCLPVELPQADGVRAHRNGAEE